MIPNVSELPCSPDLCPFFVPAFCRNWWVGSLEKLLQESDPTHCYLHNQSDTAGIPWCTNPPRLSQLKTSHHTPTLVGGPRPHEGSGESGQLGQCTSMHHGQNWGICHQDSASTMLLEVKSMLSTWDTLKQAISILASVMLLSSSTENSDKASNITCAHTAHPKELPYFCQIVMGCRLYLPSCRIKNKSRAKPPWPTRTCFLCKSFPSSSLWLVILVYWHVVI